MKKKALCIVGERLLKPNVLTDEYKSELTKLIDLKIKSPEEIKKLDEETFSNLLAEHEIIIGGWGSRLLPENYQPVKNQYYCCLSGTFQNKVLPEHAERGLLLSNWGDSISHSIAESALMMILGSLRRSGLHQKEMHIGKTWGKENVPEGRSLFNKRVGCLGFGLIAQELVKLIKPFSTSVFAYDPYLPQEVFDKFGVKKVESVEELFSSVDIVSNHSANCAETNDLVNAKTLALLPDDGVFVNTARGNSVDENALAEEHKKGRLFSSLDVYKEEPLPANSPLRDEWRCLLLPHQGGPTNDQLWRVWAHALANIKRYLNGEPLYMEISAAKMRIMT